MAAKTTLLIPIRIDGLYVESAGMQFGPTRADFSTLPYYLASGSAQNPKTPNLAESTVDRTSSLPFPKGLHLHWAKTVDIHEHPDTIHFGVDPGNDRED